MQNQWYWRPNICYFSGCNLIIMKPPEKLLGTNKVILGPYGRSIRNIKYMYTVLHDVITKLCRLAYYTCISEPALGTGIAPDWRTATVRIKSSRPRWSYQLEVQRLSYKRLCWWLFMIWWDFLLASKLALTCYIIGLLRTAAYIDLTVCTVVFVTMRSYRGYS